LRRVERCAAFAVAKVRAQLSAAKCPSVSTGQGDPGLGAGKLAAGGKLTQRLAGLKHQTPCVVGGNVNSLGDCDVTQTRKLTKHKCRTLALGKGEDVLPKLRKLFTGFDLVGHRARLDGVDIGQRHRGGGSRADEADGAVVDDAVKPRAHRQIAGAG
jgi:hypothetical protein